MKQILKHLHSLGLFHSWGVAAVWLKNGIAAVCNLKRNASFFCHQQPPANSCTVSCHYKSSCNQGKSCQGLNKIIQRHSGLVLSNLKLKTRNVALQNAPNQQPSIPETIMEVEHGDWEGDFLLQAGSCPLPCLLEGG